MSYYLDKESWIASLFAVIGDKESIVESWRQWLNELVDFTCFSLFDYLDTNRDGRITELEIQDFGRTSGISLTLNDCQRIINEYDNDSKGYLTIKEFENLVMTAERDLLKQSTLSRL